MRYVIMTSFIFFSATASWAEKMMWNEGIETKYFDSAPASVLLTASKYKAYRKLIKDMDCGPAALMLNKAFVQRYPQFSDAAAPRGPQFIRWYVHFVSHEFPDLDFCMDSLKLKHHEMMLAQDGTKIGKYFSGDMRKPPLLYFDEWRDRDHYVESIILRAAQDHKPALLEIAKLAKRGDVFELDPDFEYYLIKRACHLGASCVIYEERLKILEKMAVPEKIKQGAQMAKQKNIVLDMVYGRKKTKQK